MFSDGCRNCFVYKLYHDKRLSLPIADRQFAGRVLGRYTPIALAATWQVTRFLKEFCNASLEAVRETHSYDQQDFSSNQKYSAESSSNGCTRSYRLVHAPRCLSQRRR